MKKLLTIALAALSCSLAAQELSRDDIVVNANGASWMTALQFNLELPDGATITSDVTMGDATDGHTLCMETLDNGDYLFILYSMDLNTFKDGELLRIPITFNDDCQVRLYNIRLADTEAVSYAIEEIETSISLTSALSKSEGAIYDLSGRRVSRMTGKGIYIIGGRKVVK